MCANCGIGASVSVGAQLAQAVGGLGDDMFLLGEGEAHEVAPGVVVADERTHRDGGDTDRGGQLTAELRGVIETERAGSAQMK